MKDGAERAQRAACSFGHLPIPLAPTLRQIVSDLCATIAEIERLRGLLAETLGEDEAPIPDPLPEEATDENEHGALAYLRRYLLTGEGDVAAVRRLVAQFRGWALLVEEPAVIVGLAGKQAGETDRARTCAVCAAKARAAGKVGYICDCPIPTAHGDGA